MALQWLGQWIWGACNDLEPSEGYQSIYFRRVFSVPEGTSCTLVLRVSADSRYRLYVNGTSVAVGPCKGGNQVHYYESIDVSDQLRLGTTNVIAVEVLHYAASGVARGPLSVWRSDRGAMIVDGILVDKTGKSIELLHTDAKWRCLRNTALHFNSGEEISYFMGYAEEVYGDRIPIGWRQPDFDDSQWDTPVQVAPTIDDYGALASWRLTQRTIPPMYEVGRSFCRVVAGSSRLDLPKFFENVLRCDSSQHGYILEPGAACVVDLDAGSLTTGYPVLEFSEGNGSVVKILCSEGYVQTDSSGRQWKENRDDSSGDLKGAMDTYHVAGYAGSEDARGETYEPFWFRTFRFVRLAITVAAQPLIIRHVTYRETGYPISVESDFTCSDPAFRPLWSISLSTLRRCMHETYEDCPYFEQLQYTMDAMLECAYTYAVSPDDRLARKAIHDLHSSILPDGMLQSRYPSIEPQVIPGFALYWIIMVYHHYWQYADPSLIRRYVPAIDNVLSWFHCRLTRDGLVGVVPREYWPFVDWVDGWNQGVPLNGRRSPIVVYSLMYATALLRAADLNDWIERYDVAREYRTRALRVNAAVQSTAWSAERQMYQDIPGQETYSQHAQIWAVLADAVTGSAATCLMEKTLDDSTLAQASYAMKFFLFRALSKVGMYHRSFPLWSSWHEMVAMKLTTWAEDPVNQRSDCHGWSAVPLYEFSREILGVQPATPGYSRIVVAPKPGPLQWADGKVITPKGPVSVYWWLEHGLLRINVSGPAGVPLEIRTPLGVRHFYSGDDTRKLMCL